MGKGTNLHDSWNYKQLKIKIQIYIPLKKCVCVNFIWLNLGQSLLNKLTDIYKTGNSLLTKNDRRPSFIPLSLISNENWNRVIDFTLTMQVLRAQMDKVLVTLMPRYILFKHISILYTYVIKFSYTSFIIIPLCWQCLLTMIENILIALKGLSFWNISNPDFLNLTLKDTW